MRYTVIRLHEKGYAYVNTSKSTYHFNPEYNKLNRVSGRTDRWMLDLIKQKDGVYLLSGSDPTLHVNLFLLIPESHPLFNLSRVKHIDLYNNLFDASRVKYIDLYNQRINLFLKNVSESMVRELLNNQEI